MTGYVRKDVTNNIADGNIINAADLDAEFDGVVDAFNASTGHTHGGGVGEGAPITTIGPTQDVVASAAALTPKTTNTVDIGSSSLKFKDFYLAGNANIAGTTTLGGALTYGGVTLSNAVTGTGNMVLSTSPTLTTPTLGVATATSINKVALTAPATGSTLTIADGKTLTANSSLTLAGVDAKTLTVNNSLTLAGTDATTMTFPATSATIARTDAAQTFTGTQTFSSSPILNGGTANGVAYLDGSKVLTTGSALTFDGTNLGIGTSSPASPLQVVGEANIGLNANRVRINSSAAVGIVEFNSTDGILRNLGGSLSFQPNGSSDRMVIDSSGNVGIGTSSPTTKLQIEESNTGAASELLTVYNSGTASGTEARIKLAGGNGLSTRYAYISAINNGVSAGNGHSLVFATNANSASPAERLRIDSSGALIAKPAAGTGAVFNEDGVDADFRVESDTNTHALFVQGSDGNVGIGTSSPAQPLDVRASQNGIARFYSISPGGNAEIELLTLNSASTVGKLSKIVATQVGADTNGSILTFQTAPTTNNIPIERLRIDSTGASIFKPAAGTGAVFNEDGVDADFRVESDTNTHALFVEGSSGNVGIGTSSPVTKLAVSGAISTDTAYQFFANASTPASQSFIYRPVDNSLALGTASTERLRITSAGNVSIGGTADRATTVGTKALNIFDGTAPVGTLTNGISIYSSSGEAYVMDAAGNATLFSPHDAETNEWIFKSKHTPTGKVLRIDVEKLLRFVNDHFGLDAVQEFIEP